MTSTYRVVLAAMMVAFAIPFSASARTGNSGIAGVARDTNGGVLPGVTVEAASPVLIEKSRNTVTGDDGSYRIPNLRPGVYAVTFSLAGFRTVRNLRLIPTLIHDVAKVGVQLDF